MNAIAEFILYIYLFVLASMLLFDFLSVIYKKTSNARIAYDVKIIAEKIKKDNIAKISSKHIKELSKKLKRINYFIAFTEVIDNMEDKDKKTYLENIKSVFVNICPHYQNEEAIRQTYFLHFLAEHPYIYEDKKEIIISYLIKSTTEKSVYIREKALNALYALGNPTYIKEAFYQMNFENIKHHHKLITDGLLKYQGDINELASMLICEFENYNEEYKVACINYFGYQKIDCCKWILHILKFKNEPKEVRLACIRYFSHVKYEPVLEILYDMLKDDKKNWEYAAIAASTLKCYPSKRTIELLKETIESHNWYVRYNAASSLIMMLDKNVIDALIVNSTDRYAKDMLSYQLNLMKGRV